MLVADQRSIRLNKRWIIIFILLLLGVGIAVGLGAFDSKKLEPATSLSAPKAPAETSAMEQAKEDAEQAAQSAAAAAKEAAAKAAAKATVEAEAAVKQASADAKVAASAVGDAAKKAAAGAEKAGGAVVKELEQGAKPAGDAGKDAYDRAQDVAKQAIQLDNSAPASKPKNDKDARLRPDSDSKGVSQQAMSAAAAMSAGKPLQRGPQDGKDASSPRSVQSPTDMKTSPASREDPPPKKPEASFDVVQIERDGSGVFAGKAEPGARVVLRFADDQIVGVATAERDGSWVVLPENPLPNGESTVRLESTGSNGVTTAALQTLIISKKPGATPLVVAQSDAVQIPILVLQRPEPAASTLLASTDTQLDDAGTAASERIRTQDGALTVGTVDYDKAGRLTVQGKAPPGVDVSVDVDGKAVGSAKADAAGNWTLNTAPGAATGGARIGATANLADGGKLAVDSVAGRIPSAPLLRVSLPFAPMGLVKEFPRGRLVVVQPGNSLWRIARRTYGDGVRYSIIYAANMGQIRNPDLIYPGQIFHAPQSASARKG